MHECQGTHVTLFYACAASAFLLTIPLQPALAQEPETTVLRVTTRLIQVSVVAHDHSDNLVRDLTRDDFTLTDNGRPQRISVFSMQVAEPVPSASDQAQAPNPLVISNRTLRPSEKPIAVTVILFDALNIPRLDEFLYAKREVVKILGTLRPGDPVALYSINGPKVRVIHDFTDDSASLVLAAQKLSQSPIMHGALASPHFSLGADRDRTAQLASWLEEKSSEDEAARLRMTTEWTLTALAGVAHHLAGVPGRKSLLWISDSFPINIGLDIHSFTQGDSQRANQQLLAFSERERDIGRLLTEAQVAVYPISPSGLVVDRIYSADITAREAHATLDSWMRSGHMVTAGEEGEPRIAAMIELAKQTGGLAFYNANGVSTGIRRAIDDAGVSYILGFYPPEAAWDGKYHQIGIKVNRSGVEVRGRRGYFAGSPEAESAPEREQALWLAAASPLEGAAIGIKVNVESNPLISWGQDIVLVIDPHDVRFELVNDRMRAVVDVMLVQQDASGRSLGGMKDTLIYALLPDSYQRASSDGLFFDEKLTVMPRASRVRVLVRDVSTGAVGSVSLRVRRPD
jgi:VWFA-related protein